MPDLRERLALFPLGAMVWEMMGDWSDALGNPWKEKKNMLLGPGAVSLRDFYCNLLFHTWRYGMPGLLSKTRYCLCRLALAPCFYDLVFVTLLWSPCLCRLALAPCFYGLVFVTLLWSPCFGRLVFVALLWSHCFCRCALIALFLCMSCLCRHVMMSIRRFIIGRSWRS